MQKIILIFLVLLSMPLFSKQSFADRRDMLFAKLNTTWAQVNQEGLVHESKFHQWLVKDSDANIQILGYWLMLKYNTFKEKSQQDIAFNIEEIVRNNNLSNHSLALAEIICRNLTDYCNQQQMFDSLYQAMPKNAYIYIDLLHQAYQYNDNSEINALMDDLAGSQYVDIFPYAHKDLRPKLEAFIKVHPFPKNKLELEKLWVITPSTSQEIQDKIASNIENHMVLMMIINVQLRSPIPAYRDLVDICKEESKYAEHCLQIANVFIKKSKSIITRAIGYSIKIEILKQQNKEQQWLKVQSQKDSYQEKYECFANLITLDRVTLFLKGNDLHQIAEPTYRNDGEVEYFKKLAELHYNHLHSLQGKIVKNPKECES